LLRGAFPTDTVATAQVTVGAPMPDTMDAAGTTQTADTELGA
jgi:hypothetical protein